MDSSIQAKSSCASHEQHTNLPPSRNTRRISGAFVSGWVNSLVIKLKQSYQPMNPHKAMSNVPVGNPRFLASVNKTAAFFKFCRSNLEWAIGVQPGHMSMPEANPRGPIF